MLSYMRLPRAEESGAVPLSVSTFFQSTFFSSSKLLLYLQNDRFVFVNLYKIHCQCLLDSALAANLAQMRHYVMHFWQQLPRSVPVYARSMAALDAHMYALLEDIYAGSVEAPVEGLRRLNTVAHLLPVWLKRTFQVVVPNSIAGIEGLWALLEPEEDGSKCGLMNIEHSRRRGSVGELKVEEATRWSVRIQFKVDFILGVKVGALRKWKAFLKLIFFSFCRKSTLSSCPAFCSVFSLSLIRFMSRWIPLFPLLLLLLLLSTLKTTAQKASGFLSRSSTSTRPGPAATSFTRRPRCCGTPC